MKLWLLRKLADYFIANKYNRCCNLGGLPIILTARRIFRYFISIPKCKSWLSVNFLASKAALSRQLIILVIEPQYCCGVSHFELRFPHTKGVLIIDSMLLVLFLDVLFLVVVSKNTRGPISLWWVTTWWIQNELLSTWYQRLRTHAMDSWRQLCLTRKSQRLS